MEALIIGGGIGGLTAACLLRDAGHPHMVAAPCGQYQQSLKEGRTYQLLRLRIDPALALIPEISANRLMVSIRLMRPDADGKLKIHQNVIQQLTANYSR